MLKRKMLRDIKNNIAQYTTIFLMVFIGVFVYTGVKAYMYGMNESAKKYYRDNNLQSIDVYGYLSNDDILKILEMNNVNNVSSKLTLPKLGNVENFKNHKVEMNFIDNNDISKFYVVDGNKYDVSLDGVWLDYYYASKNNLKVGDILSIDYDGYKFKKEILGIITVPDHVYYIKDDTELFPNHSNYGFVYMSVRQLPDSIIKKLIKQNLKINDDRILDNIDCNKYIAYTNAMIDIIDNNKKEITKKNILKTVDKAYLAMDVNEELSYKTYQMEIEQGESFVGIFSGLFIVIAILSVVTTMTRVVRKERIQIGTLKALGFSNFKIVFHYVSYGIFLSMVASILGIVFGYYFIGQIFIEMEMEYYVVPDYRTYLDPSTYIVSIIVVILISIATYFSTKNILSKNAAETLRVERPNVNSKNLSFTNKGILKKLPFSDRWNIRDMIRNKARTLMGLFGITGCVILLVASFGIYDTINSYLKLEYNVINNYEYKLNLSDAICSNRLMELKNIYGDNTSMSKIIEIDVNKELISTNIFVNDSNDFYKIIDENENSIKLPNDGVYITRKLAQAYGYKIGDKIRWHISGSNKYYESEIKGFNMDPQNQNMTMSKEYYESLNLTYKPDSLYTNKEVPKKISGVASIQSIDQMITGVNNMMNTMITMIVLIIVVAVILGIVIIYNMGVLSFAEKNYQFATLKVLGFSDKKISHIFIKQNIWITVISIIIGLPLATYILNELFIEALGNDYDFKVMISLVSYILATIGTLLVSYLASLLLTGKVKKIDMVTSLKGNE